MRLGNLDALMRDMSEKHWHITAFTFRFGEVTATVLVEDVSCFSPKEENSIARLTFHDINERDRILKTEASNDALYVGLSDIRAFFKIGWIDKVGDLLTDFYSRLNNAIPPEHPVELNQEENQAINECRNRGDHNNGTCIFAVKHNANNGQRSPFNDDKAKSFCPDVYEEYRLDTNISFCFRETNALSLDEIRNNFAKNPQFRS